MTKSANVLPPGRVAGVCLHITSLPGEYGIGEIGKSAFEFVDTLCEMGLAVWQFLPTGPTAYGDSPYQPLSSFAGNELLIDIGDLVKKRLLYKKETMELRELPADCVDYGALIPIKNRLLHLAAERFDARASRRFRAARDNFVKANNDSWLHDYALFRVLKSRHDERPWPEWSPQYRHRDAEALRQIESGAAAQIAGIKTIQFLFHEQWSRFRDYANSRGVYLFGDLPIYIALDSADAWAAPEMLRIDSEGRPDAVAGVPPDYFSEDGQLWGNPLYDWAMHKRGRYGWWIERLRASAKLADIVRIDHFRGFESYWSVPAGSDTARTGAWEPGPGDAIFEAMRKSLGTLPIIAENLGVITPEVEALRKRHGIPGMIVLQFDIADEQFDLKKVAPDTVCYTGTHDNDTTPGWFKGSPDDKRSREEIEATQRSALQKTGGSPGTIGNDMIRAAFSTDARLAIAPMQDYLELGSEARFNVPGTSGNNWRWRVVKSQLCPALVRRVTALVETADRSP